MGSQKNLHCIKLFTFTLTKIDTHSLPTKDLEAMKSESLSAKPVPLQDDRKSLCDPNGYPHSARTSQELGNGYVPPTNTETHVPPQPINLAPGTIWTCGSCFAQEGFRFVDPAENPGPPDPWEATATDCYLYDDSEVWCTGCGKKDTARWDISQLLSKSERTVWAWHARSEQVNPKTDGS